MTSFGEKFKTESTIFIGFLVQERTEEPKEIATLLELFDKESLIIDERFVCIKCLFFMI